MKLTTTLCVLLILGVSLAYSQTPQTLSPEQILEKMVSVYASCNSYADEGEVRTIFIQNGARRTVVKPFSTAFVRPSNFRFEFEDRRPDDNWIYYIVWRDATSIKSSWSIKPGIRTFESLSLALAGATGVSSSAAINVPSLLMSDLGDSHRIQTLSQLRLTGEETIGGQTAFGIEGRDWRSNLVTIWIDKESFLLLKIYETKKFESFETETTTTYRPHINANISPEKLAFQPR